MYICINQLYLYKKIGGRMDLYFIYYTWKFAKCPGLSYPSKKFFGFNSVLHDSHAMSEMVVISAFPVVVYSCVGYCTTQSYTQHCLRNR